MTNVWPILLLANVMADRGNEMQLITGAYPAYQPLRWRLAGVMAAA